MGSIAKIVSGGQTGVDRAALDAAIAAGFPYGGWAPLDGRAEDMPDAPGLLAHYPRLRPTRSRSYVDRTVRNVCDSDATLIIVPAVDWGSPGTNLTVKAARKAKRPYVLATRVEGCIEFVDQLWGEGLTLNVAGPRASSWPEGYDVTVDIISALISRVGQPEDVLV